MFAEFNYARTTTGLLRSSAILALLLGLLAAGWSPGANAGYAAIFGFVTDKETEQRIGGARIELNIHTDLIERHSFADGTYFVGTPNGNGYTLRISKEGYRTRTISDIRLPDNYQMHLNIQLEPYRSPALSSTFLRLNQKVAATSYPTRPYRITRPTRIQYRGVPASPELADVRVWILPTEENQFVGQVEIKGTGLNAIEELGIFDEAGELVPNTEIHVPSVSAEAMILEYRLSDQSAANLVRSIRLTAGDETISLPIRHDFLENDNENQE